MSEKFACICAHLEYAIYLFCILQILRPIVTKSKRRKNEPIHFPIFGKVQVHLRIPIPKRETWLIRQHPCDFILFFKFFSQKSATGFELEASSQSCRAWSRTRRSIMYLIYGNSAREQQLLLKTTTVSCVVAFAFSTSFILKSYELFISWALFYDMSAVWN